MMKSNITDPLYQSTFLPLFSRAELELKKIILDAYLLKTSRFLLLTKIQALIKLLDEKIPQDLPNRKDYFDGLNAKAQLWIKQYYDRPLKRFIVYSALLYTAMMSNKTKMIKIETPEQLLKALDDKKINPQVAKDMWTQAKGSVRVADYPTEIKNYISKMSSENLTTSGAERPISLWQKAELDIRHKHQEEHLQQLLDDGVELAYLSSHPDCSKRCEKWQGKLVSLTEHARLSGMRVRKASNGEWVYSLTDIMAQTDKYGYHNNIISGFNCRHHLIPYKEGTEKPNVYEQRDIKKEREINSNLRKMEREIRETKVRSILYSKTDARLSKKLKKQAEILTQKYKDYATKNGFAWFDYRIKV